MQQVGIYRRDYPRISEFFIAEQVANLQRYDPFIILGKSLHEIPTPHVALNECDFLGIKQAVHWITASPDVFPSARLKDLSLIHGHFGIDGIYAMRLAEKLKIPFIVTFYGYDATVSRSAMISSANPSMYQFLFYEKELQQKAALFIAFSSFIYKKMIERGYPEDRTIQLNCGVNIKNHAPTEQKPDERYILSIGRHTEKKGIDTLLKAFSQICEKHPDVSLIQIGAGAMTTKLKALTSELELQHRVQFLGATPHDRCEELLKGAEIFALPSQTASNGDSEGLPVAILEAAACGLPVVSTWHSGIPDAVIDGETGFLVAEKDDKALAERLDVLLSDRALAQKMGRHGREFVCENFDIVKQTAKLEAVYDSVLNRRTLVSK